MKLRKEFIYRLWEVHNNIEFVLEQYKWDEDNFNKEINPRNLFPSLAKVFNYLCTSKNATKK